MKRSISAYFGFSAFFWFCALTIGGLIVILHGDCFADTACQAEERKISLSVMVGAALVYAVLLSRLARRRRMKDLK